MRDRLDRLAQRARHALEGDILPFWLRLEDRDHGGHFAAMDNAGRIDRTAAKSTVFVARLLWTLSTVHRVLGVPEAAGPRQAQGVRLEGALSPRPRRPRPA